MCESLKKMGGAESTRVCDSNGEPTNSAVGEKSVVRAHFSEQLGGSSSSLADLILCERKQSMEIQDVVASTGIGKCLPECCELAHYLSCSNNGATGEHNIRGKIYRRYPRLFASTYFPIVLKTFCRLSPRPPPLQWGGGILPELFVP